MITEGDIQLSFRILESLTTNLRDLAVKYELLVRDSNDRQKLAASLESMTKDVSSLTAMLSRITETHDAEIGDVFRRLEDIAATAKKIAGFSDHADQHLDESSRQMGQIGSAVNKLDDISAQTRTALSGIGEIKTLSSSVLSGISTIKDDLIPVKKLSSYLSKPITWILLIWTLLATAIGVVQVYKEWKEWLVPSTPVAVQPAMQDTKPTH